MNDKNEKSRKSNELSLIFFSVSSGSLLTIPLWNFGRAAEVIAFVFAAVFWTCLVLGIAFQIKAGILSKKSEKTIKKRKPGAFEKAALLAAAVFLLLLAIIMLFMENNAVLFCIDLALMLLSIEIYFYLKRRYSA